MILLLDKMIRWKAAAWVIIIIFFLLAHLLKEILCWLVDSVAEQKKCVTEHCR